MADLLGHEGLTRRAARQAAMAAAKERAALGMSRAARRAARVSIGYVEVALQAVKRYAASNPGEWTTEQMRSVLEPDLPPVPEARVWGYIVVQAIKAGYMERVPRKFAPAASSNGCPKPLWKRSKGALLETGHG